MSKIKKNTYKTGTYRDYLDFNKSSKFWLGTDTYNNLQRHYNGTKNINLEELLSKVKILHTISNFIKIISNKTNIEVNYEGAQSSTDGKKITISANVKDFDFVCGQAMHEAGHLLYSQKLLAWLEEFVNKYVCGWKTSFPAIPVDTLINSIFDRFETRQLNNRTANSMLKTFIIFKDILNFVEDRRIDSLVISKYPGYKGYYDTITVEGLWNPNIKAELLKLKGQETWGGYISHLFSLLDENPDLDALKGLRKISNILDIKNINNVTNVNKVLAIAVAIFKEIEKNVEEDKTKSESTKDEDTNRYDEKNDPNIVDKELSKNIKKAINIINGESKKEKLTFEEQSVYQLLNNKTGDYYLRSISALGKKFEVVVIERMTENIKNIFPGVFVDLFELKSTNSNRKAIESGINKGKSLANKLMLTNDDKMGYTPRKKSGYIDTRILSEIPSGNVKIFKRKFVDIQEKTYLHITLDSSGSMFGSKWCNALEMAAMFASASKLLKNLEVEITCRSTMSLPIIFNRTIYILKMFDSAIHDLAYLRKWWPIIKVNGYTPEGLAFDTTADIIKKRAKDKNKLFVNISDGCPGCDGYSGNEAIDHTKKVIDGLRQDGFIICSYLIDVFSSSSVKVQFERMYGKKDSHKVTQVDPLKIAHTINPYLIM